LLRVDRKYGLVWLDVIETGPFEEKSACGDIEFWEESISLLSVNVAEDTNPGRWH